MLPALKKIFGLPPARKRQSGNIVAADAVALVAAFGDGAYEEARTRGREERRRSTIDANRPFGHWDKVKREIARHTGKEIGADSASRYPDA
jgi:hypothetical protein